MRARSLALALVAVAALLTAACSDSDSTGGSGGTQASGETLVVYSGRTEELVGPLIERFEQETGIDVEVRYGDSTELAAQIIEEGDNSPADVYFGQDAGSLGALGAADRLAPLDQATLDLVPAAYRSPEGTWVGTSARARVVVYNTDAVTEAELPDGIAGFTDPAWKGRIGWAPTNGSFQAFVTAMRVLEGEDATRDWLEGIQANQPKVYDRNTAIVDAAANGEIDAGFVNHYYLYRLLAENPTAAAANKFYGDGDPGGLVNVAGAGILATSDRQDAAARFVSFLLSEGAQEYFVTETFEIPLLAGVPGPEGVPAITELTQPDIDLAQLEDLAGTLALLEETGVL